MALELGTGRMFGGSTDATGQIPNYGGLSPTGISDGSVVQPILLSRNLRRMTAKRLRRIRTMKMDPELLIVALGEEESDRRPRKRAFWEHGFWGRVQLFSWIRAGLGQLGNRSDIGSIVSSEGARRFG
jgi:hypothetical protein